MTLSRPGLSGADGAYLFHIFVDEEPPQSIAAFLHDPQTVETFHVPSGRLLAGEEYFIGALSIAQHPHMGQEVELPAGDYTLTAFRVEAPESYVDDRFSTVASTEEQRAWTRASALPGWCVLGTILALVTAYFAYVSTQSIGIAALPIGLAALGWAWMIHVRRTSAFAAAERLYREPERELPSIALVLAHRTVA